jgi:hypothetical protein
MIVHERKEWGGREYGPTARQDAAGTQAGPAAERAI